MARSALWCGVLCAALLSGCATFRNYGEEMNVTLSEAASNNLNGAIKTLDSNNRGKKSRDLLYHLERGELQRLAREYTPSQASWTLADGQVQRWEETARTDPSRLLPGAASYLINDKLRPYDGHDYEKVMLTTRMALNFLAQGDLDHARVAIKQTHEREAVIAALRTKELERIEREAQEKGIKPSFKELNGYPVETIDNAQVNALRNSYQSAFSHYLAGFIYEAQGEPSLAAAGYRQAIELHPGHAALEDALSGLEARVAAPSDGLTDVLFVVDTGLVPARESVSFPLPLPIDDTLVLVPIAFPVIRAQAEDALPEAITLDGSTFPITPVTDLDLMARRALKDEMPGIVLRAALRSTAKAVAQYQLQREANRQDSVELGIAAIALTIGSLVTESADERSWRTLPAQIAIARGKIAPGRQRFSLRTASGVQDFSADISGSHAAVAVRLLRGRLFTMPPVGLN